MQENFRSYEERLSRQMHGEISRVVAESLDAYFKTLKVADTRNEAQLAARSNQTNDNNANRDINLLPGSRRIDEEANMVPQSAACKIISGWKLTFDGSLTSVQVDEFIYRVNALTDSTLRGDYRSLCQNVHMLFEGNAKRWYWRYHHSVLKLDWVNICDNLRKDFKDFRTDFEIKESIRSLKQKVGEYFETYFDHILSTADSLKHPLTERELVKIVLRNFQPEIRLELLHLELNCISDLRKACRKRESLVAELQTKLPSQRTNLPLRRNVSEVDIEKEEACKEDVCAAIIGQGQSIEKRCWNCDELHHNYKHCTKPRRVFCYGCGLIAFFLPYCARCNDTKNEILDVSKQLRHPFKTSEVNN